MFYIYIYIYICASAIIFEVNRSLENFAFKMKGGEGGCYPECGKFYPLYKLCTSPPSLFMEELIFFKNHRGEGMKIFL